MTPTELSNAAAISVSYASMLLSGDRKPSLKTALSIYDKTGLLFGALKELTPDEIQRVRELLREIQSLAA